MTIQVGDGYLRYGQLYHLLKQENFTPFDPYSYGFNPKSASTSCASEYWCEYKIEYNGIFLDKLYIHSNDEEYPTINGKTYDVDASGEPIERMGCRVYSDLNINLMENGKILIGKDLIAKPGTRDAYLPYGYKTLREIIFRDGKNVHEINWDDEIERIRKIRNGDRRAKAYKKEHWWLKD